MLILKIRVVFLKELLILRLEFMVVFILVKFMVNVEGDFVS